MPPEMSHGVPDRAGYLAGWSARHGGFDPHESRWVLGWLSLTYRVARPLAVWRVPPGGLTAAGLLLGGAVAGLALAGGRWPLAAAAVVVLCGLTDSLDGAVATLRGLASPWGTVLDSAVDRCTELFYLIALWVLGAPGALCAAAGALTLLHESSRASAAAAGMSGIGVITVWERPSRLIVVTLTLVAAGAAPALSDAAATTGAAVATALAIAGWTQLLVVVYRRLNGPGTRGS